MNIFRQVLKDYLMVVTMEDAEKWITRQPCSAFRRELFLRECAVAIGESKDGTPLLDDYHRIQDRIDSLRRAPYVGMGIG